MSNANETNESNEQNISLRRPIEWTASSGMSMAFHTILLIFLALVSISAKRDSDSAEFSMSNEPTQVEDLEIVEHQKMQLETVEFESVTSESLESEMEVTVDMKSDALENATADVPTESDSFDTSMLAGDWMAAAGGTGEGEGVATMFGLIGTSADGEEGGEQGMVGKFYDLKQNRSRQKLPYSGDFPGYIASIGRVTTGGLTDAATKQYYLATRKLTFTQLFIPADTPAQDAPRAFDVEKEVEPRGWFIHYTATLLPPAKGDWRFVGFFDDMLIVYVNNQPVLDASWVPMCGVGNGPYDNSLRQEFGTTRVPGTSRINYYGKWVKINKPAKIDILIGETPGGLVGGLLMAQQAGVEYQTRDDGTPILPLFATTRTGIERIENDPRAKEFGFPSAIPVWKVVKPTKKL